MSTLTRVHDTVASAQRRTRVAATAAAVATGGLVVALAVLVLGGGRWLALTPAAPFMAWGVALAAGWFVQRTLRRRWHADTSLQTVVAAVELEHGLRWGSLVGLMQISESGGAFVGRELQRVAGVLGTRPIAPLYVTSLTQRSRRMMALVSGSIVAFLVAAQVSPDGSRALFQPIDAARGTLLAPLTWSRTPTVAVRGDRVQAVVDAPGRNEVSVRWRAVGAAWRDTVITVTDGVGMLALGVFDAPVQAVATDGRARTDTLSIELRERPYAGDVAIRAVYPAYLGRAAETLAGDAPLRVPEGTTLEFTTRVAGLTEVGVRGGRDSVRATIAAGRARTLLTVRAPMSWEWWSPTAGADLPLPMVIDVEVDAAPVVEIIAPSRDSLIAPTGRVRALVAATDDHAVATVRLRVWREDAQGQRGDERVLQLGGARGERWIGEGEVLVESLGAVAGETVVLVAEARDAAPFGRVGVSAPVRLRIPTMSERRDDAIAAADSAVREAMAAAAAQRALERRTSDAAKTRQSTTPTANAPAAGSRDGAASFEAQERAKALADAQQAMGERVQELSQRASDLAKQLQAAGVMDSSVQSQLKEAQRLLREAMTPELAQQLRDLEARRQQMSGDELQDALGKMQPQQQQMQEALQRSTELLKRAALEGSMQALGDEAKEVAQAQRQYADSAAAPPRPGTAKELAARAEAVRQNARELAERLEKELAPEGRSGVQKAGSEAGESAREMQRAASAAEQQARADTQRERADSVAAAARAPSQGQQAQQAQQSQQSQQGQQGQQSRQSQQGQQGQQGTQGQQAGAAPGMDGMKAPGGAPGSSGESPNAEARQAADRAADAMDKAAESMAAARSAQIAAWKQDLTGALDASIQETLQMARQQDELSKQAQQGNTGNDVRGQQSAVQQGVQQTAERMSQQGRQSALVSPRTQQAMAEAQQRVSQATQEMNGGASGSQAAQTMAQAADALRQAAASMARDRERAGNAESASGLPELMQQMQDMARQQGALNGASSQMMPGQGDASSAAAQAQAMAKLAERQRELARGLHEAADADRTGRADAMAREADQLAQALGRGQLDPSVLDRQQRLFRRMLDAGRSLEQDERDDTSKREARAADPAVAATGAGGATRGAAAQKYREPTYDELRGLTADERRLVIEYFRRLNAGQR